MRLVAEVGVPWPRLRGHVSTRQTCSRKREHGTQQGMTTHEPVRPLGFGIAHRRRRRRYGLATAALAASYLLSPAGCRLQSQEANRGMEVQRSVMRAPATSSVAQLEMGESNYSSSASTEAQPGRWHQAESDGHLAYGSELIELNDELTLADAVGIALRANPDLHAAQARLEAALARIEEVKADFLPSLTLNHKSSRTFLVPVSTNRFVVPFTQQQTTIPDTGLQLTPESLLNALTRDTLFGNRPGSLGDTNSFSEHSTSLVVGWKVFDGFVREARLMSARHRATGGVAAIADVQRLVVQAVESAYYHVQLGLEQLRIAQADEAFSRDQLDLARKRFEAGKVRQTDVLNFEVRVFAAQAQVIAARGMRDTGRTLLAELMAVPTAVLPDYVTLSPLTPESEAELTAQDDESVWVQSALENHPGLRVRRTALAVAEEGVRSARGRFYPEFSVTGSYGLDRISNMEYAKEDQASALALEMNLPLYTGGFRTSLLARARAIQQEKEAQLHRQRLKVMSDVRQSIIALRDAQEQVHVQRANRDVSLENRRIVTQEYAAGKVALERLNLAQRDYTETDANLARARIRMRLAWSDLRAAVGAPRRDSSVESAPDLSDL